MNVNKLDNLEEMHKFLEAYNLSRLNQEEIDNLNRSVTSSETESVIIKKKRDSNNKIRNERGDTTNDNTEIIRII